MVKFKVKKGDKVVVIAGKNKGATGQILSVLKQANRVIIQGVNMVKKHTKPSFVSGGGIVEIESSIHVSNVQICDPKTDKPTRIGYKVLEDGKKVRFAKKSGEVLSN